MTSSAVLRVCSVGAVRVTMDLSSSLDLLRDK